MCPFRDGPDHAVMERSSQAHTLGRPEFDRHRTVIMSAGVNEHLSKQFDAELESIRSRVLEMGGLVESQIRRALEGFGSGDRALLDDVIATDRRVNEMEVALDGACSHVIVKRQPAANDLRLIFAITKTVTDLERIGDAAQKIERMRKSIHEREGGNTRLMP